MKLAENMFLFIYLFNTHTSTSSKLHRHDKPPCLDCCCQNWNISDSCVLPLPTLTQIHRGYCYLTDSFTHCPSLLAIVRQIHSLFLRAHVQQVLEEMEQLVISVQFEWSREKHRNA